MWRDAGFFGGVGKARFCKTLSRAGRWPPLQAIAILVALGTGPSQAAIVAWSGGSTGAGSNGNWSNIANWSGGTPPGSTTGATDADIALFNSGIANTWGNAVGNPVVINSASQNLGGINFDAAAGSYFIGSTAGNPLLLTSGGSIQILGTFGSANTETINAPLVIEGGTYTFANNSGAGILDFGGAISGGSAVAAVLNLNGANTTANTVSGIISNGSAASLGVTQNGAGAWTLTGANTYTGATTINNGTINISGAAGSINGSSGITLDNGTLTVINAATQTGVNRIGSSASIASNGGTFNWNNASSANAVYAQTIGTIALGSGQLNVVLGTNQTGASNTQTLTLGGLTQSGAGAVAFSVPGGLNATTNIVAVAGASGGGATSGQIIGPWATVGSGAAAQTDYAVYTAAGQVVPANIAATTDTSWTSTAGNYTLAAADTLAAARTINTLRFNTSAQTLNLAQFNLQTSGILNGGSGLLTISSGGGVLSQNAASAGNLYVTTGNSGITISAPIQNNSGALTLVKDGSGGVLTLSGLNTFSGGVALDAGQITLGSATALGSGGLTIFGGATLDSGVANLYLPANNPLILNGDFTFNGTNSLNLAPARSRWARCPAPHVPSPTMPPRPVRFSPWAGLPTAPTPPARSTR